MARTVPIFVGDKVKTPVGNGYVEDVFTWRDRVEEMNDYEAAEFSQNCKDTIGPEYKSKWCEVFVRVGRARRKFLFHQLEILEGRDDGKRKSFKVEKNRQCNAGENHHDEGRAGGQASEKKG